MVTVFPVPACERVYAGRGHSQVLVCGCKLGARRFKLGFSCSCAGHGPVGGACGKVWPCRMSDGSDASTLCANAFSGESCVLAEKSCEVFLGLFLHCQ